MKKITTNIQKTVIASEPDVLYAVRQNKVNADQIERLKELSGLKDESLASSLNLNIKTFRSYKSKSTALKPYLQEHILMLLQLFIHGTNFFGSTGKFHEWLTKKNYFFDNDMPLNFLNTISGIRFTDDRITSMEYGDTV